MQQTIESRSKTRGVRKGEKVAHQTQESFVQSTWRMIVQSLMVYMSRSSSSNVEPNHQRKHRRTENEHRENQATKIEAGGDEERRRRAGDDGPGCQVSLIYRAVGGGASANPSVFEIYTFALVDLRLASAIVRSIGLRSLPCAAHGLLRRF